MQPNGIHAVVRAILGQGAGKKEKRKRTRETRKYFLYCEAPLGTTNA